MNVSIVAPNKTLYSGKAVAITVPGKNGSFTALENHAPIVSILDKGTISVQAKAESEKVLFEIKSGFVEIHDNIVTICVEVA
ncbi:MAG: F0F1 ATP synthase subunit epsilon [Paludibacteraceae bacterium]|jgi:F-type H+-transporting ATPase subunit epsilon|nr:F0F1 ATP synthase subunit epsilon [Paludibacteraceae bacterium]OQA50569.1 MAG: ATP synthase epsilon chain [Bacteroidetes bacterium ADurb.Bin302]HPG55823.1 F0F1 ATP synthase subunit epsilon [Candidatus Enterocola sp.]